MGAGRFYGGSMRGLFEPGSSGVFGRAARAQSEQWADVVPIHVGAAVSDLAVRAQVVPLDQAVDGVSADAELRCDIVDGRCVHAVQLTIANSGQLSQSVAKRRIVTGRRWRRGQRTASRS